MTVEREQEPSNSAFVSYRSPYRRVAERLQRSLYRIADRHEEQTGEFRVFLDSSALKPGPLRENVYSALRRSHHLVVLLDAHTATSDWVSDEITHWLGNGGHADRLFLVRVDPDADLGWDGERFTNAAAVPAPLRELFREEPKWIDFRPRRLLGPDQAGLAGLCGALMDADVEQFGLVEAANQRDQVRTRTRLAGVMAVLLVLAVVAAIFAYVNQQRAQANADQAQAQADSAEALLAAQGSPTLAIERALQAAARSDSPTVRSALLAVSQAAGRLVHAVVYPEADTGHPTAAAHFSGDGGTLLAWGADREPGTSRVHGWDVTSGAVTMNVTVPVADLRVVVPVGSRVLAACGASGPVLIDPTAGSTTTTPLDRGWPARPTPACVVREFADGVVLLVTDSAGQGSATVVHADGRVEPVDGITSVAAHPAGRSALLAGPAGAVVVTAGGAAPVATTPGGQARFADAVGNFLLSWGPEAWGVVTQGPGGPAARPVAVPAGAVDVAPELDYGPRMTGELAWITADGTLGWTAGPARTVVENAQGQPTWTPYRTRLEPTTDGTFVVVYGSTAMVARPPRAASIWAQRVAEDSLGSASNPDEDAVSEVCTDRQAVLLRLNRVGSGSLVVRGSGESGVLTGRGAFTASCQTVDIGDTLAVQPLPGWALGPDDRLELRAPLVTDLVAVAPTGDRVAIIRSGFPIEILSMLPTDELPRPWDVTTGRFGEVTAFGERELFVDYDLAIVDRSGTAERIPLPGQAELLAARPDGTGAVVALQETGSTRLPVGSLLVGSLLVGSPLVGSRGTIPAHPACSAPVRYLPGPDFARSLPAAEGQIPVTAGFLDCRDGRRVPWEAGLEIVDYDVGAATGRIVARNGSATTVTTWTRGDPASLRTTPGPPLPPAGGAVSFDPGGQLAVTYPAAGRRLTLYRHDGTGWQSTLILGTGLPEVVDAQVVDGGTLVLAVSRRGGFELFDVATGRLVASDPTLEISLQEVTAGFSARRVGEELIVVLDTAEDREFSRGMIQIPVGIPALKRQLCALYAAKECAG